jgi:protein-disulfide isomerase
MNPKLTLAAPITEKDHAQGPADAPVTLVEYGDYECPYCLYAFPLVKQIRQAMDGRLRFIFRHFPQNTIHAHAGVAAQVAEAAGAQGQFWAMHDLLYEHQKELGEIDFSRFAIRLGLELYKFQSDLSSERFARHVEADFRGGVRSGVKGTPAFFIKGVRYEGALELEPLRSAVEAAAGGGA